MIFRKPCGNILSWVALRVNRAFFVYKRKGRRTEKLITSDKLCPQSYRYAVCRPRKNKVTTHQRVLGHPSVFLTGLYAGVLAKQLDAYLALPNSLTNQKKMREAKSRLITAASKRIDGCKGQLSEQDIKTLKEAVNRFVSSKNEVLSRKVMQALDKNNWKALRIEVPKLSRIYSAPSHTSHKIVSFSRAKREHMDKMRIEFSKITPHPSLLQAVDRLDPMYQLEFAGPPKILLDFFIKIFYPILSPRRQVIFFFPTVTFSFNSCSQNKWPGGKWLGTSISLMQKLPTTVGCYWTNYRFLIYHLRLRQVR